MKTYKTIQRNYEDKVIDTVTCDICKEVYPNENWNKATYDIEETKISYKSGSSYGEDGGNSTEYSFDICPICFKTRLIPLLEKEFSIEVTETESDW